VDSECEEGVTLTEIKASSTKEIKKAKKVLLSIRSRRRMLEG